MNENGGQQMQLKFAANLSFLFQDIQRLPDRYKAAKKAGFLGVECADPYSFAIEQLAEAKREAQIEQILINSFKGCTKGLAAIPNRQEEFKQCLELSIQYCLALKCKCLHILAGVYPEGEDIEERTKCLWRETYIHNLRYASKRLEMDNIIILIEPFLNIPNYFLTCTDQAVGILKELDLPNVKLLLDLYHHQKRYGEITNTLTNHQSFLGHIQISQIPDRNVPENNVEINYDYIFNHLLRIGYTGWIGCEYIPKGSKGFGWIEPYLQRDDDMTMHVLRS